MVEASDFPIISARKNNPFLLYARSCRKPSRLSLSPSVPLRDSKREARAPIFLIMIDAKFTRLDGGFPLRNGIYDSAYCTIELWMHLGSLLRTQAARVALGYASSDSYASFVFSNLPRASITWWSHAHVYHFLIFFCFIVISSSFLLYLYYAFVILWKCL